MPAPHPLHALVLADEPDARRRLVKQLGSEPQGLATMALREVGAQQQTEVERLTEGQKWQRHQSIARPRLKHGFEFRKERQAGIAITCVFRPSRCSITTTVSVVRRCGLAGIDGGCQIGPVHRLYEPVRVGVLFPFKIAES